jgi:hypothetical protein
MPGRAHDAMQEKHCGIRAGYQANVFTMWHMDTSFEIIIAKR